MVSKLKDTLLLVGGADSDRPRLREIFSSSFDLLEAQTVSQATLLLQQNGSCIAAVLADLPPDDPDSLRMLTAACSPGSPQAIPLLLFITPTGTGEREELAFALGATDVIVRPYTPTIAQRRVQVIIDLFLHKWHLETLVNEQSQTIRSTSQVMVDALSAIIEYRSTESGNHVLRIRRFTEILLTEVARTCPQYGLTKDIVSIIANASALHDIGKISIPDRVLNKPGLLTDEEYDVIKTHTTVGGELVRTLSGMGDEEYLRYAYNIALYHHERWDGTGYPKGLCGDEIPVCAQVVGLADAFDALTSPRIYKPALPYDQAVNMILNGECGSFSPALLECFKRVRTQFVQLAHRYADGHSPKSDHITLPLPGPEWKTHALDSLQLSQVKYQAILHYINDTVLELDLDSDLYHVVYNPNPDLDGILPNAPFPRIMEHLHTVLHPDDAVTAQELTRFLSDDFFRLNLRRHVFPCRLFSPTLGEYQPYELVFLRVNTGNTDQRIVTAIWHRAERVHTTGTPLDQTDLHTTPALYGLVSTALRCRTDAGHTIDAGMKNLFVLTGYTEQELHTQFRDSLLQLVVPEDRDEFLRALTPGGRADTEYRILRKNNDPIWVLDRSRTFLEADGQEYVYHAIRDNTQIRRTINHLQAEVTRHALLTQQSEGVIFELDLDSDTLTCSPRWKEMFGYDPIREGFLSNLPLSSHFHPDDLSTLSTWADSMRRNAHTLPHIEVRVLGHNGKYVWCRIRAQLQRDEAKGINRIVGILYDVDEDKRAALTLKERAERDALTKLLNKQSTQQMVSERLSQQTDTLSALLILDLDNFKGVNDKYGHLYGDAVLSQIGNSLRHLFRSQDIIGRIGGDEFLIFLNDVPNAELVQERCRQLLDTFRALFAQLVPELKVSCSIGAALAPLHANGYTELFRHADEALYLAKARGKNRYKLYSPRDKYNALLENVTYESTRIDSDEQPNITDNSFIRFVFRLLYESRDLTVTVNELLAHIGSQFNVSRAYIFENNVDNTVCSNTFEWCNTGVSPEKDNLQNVSYITDIPGWPEVYDENGLLYCSDVAELPANARAILEPQGVKSMLHCSIRDNGVFRGYIGFDDCVSTRLWTQEQISLLQFLSEVMALFLLKKRTQDKLSEQAANLQNVLDSQDSWIYVIDPATYHLRFLNKKIRTLAPKARPGMICYRAFMGIDHPCPSCPLACPEQSSIIQNDKLGVQVCAQTTDLLWNGKRERMITCLETD